MRYSSYFAVFSLLLIPLCSVAQNRDVPRTFDHTMYVQVETTPRGADIHAISATKQKITRKLGVSPCTTAIGFTWSERFNRRSWRALTVWCPGDACRAEYDKKTKTYDIYFSCAAVKKGYRAKDTEVKIATLTPPGYGWDIPDTWPKQVIVDISLQQREVRPENSKKKSSAPRTLH